ncbi:MAG TPA: cytochrome c3 family protein [Lacunisphaera sp.]|jgi:cytochrome b subunit of formate dehydrogenase|nr:cytochrome c3 family protein [Lacunisphaera sp.]
MNTRLSLRCALSLLMLTCLVARTAAADAPGVPAPAPAAAAKAIPNSECLDCHEAEFKSRKKGEAPQWIGVRSEVYAKSVHAGLECVDCHDTITETPHAAKLPAVDCTSCHDKLAAKHAFHPRLALTPLPTGQDTSCVQCHGAHDTSGVKKKEFAFYDGAQSESCGRCHEAAKKDYLASAHGTHPAGTARATPDCLGCHAQRIASRGAGVSAVELKLAQAKLCESCHVGKPEVAGQSMLGAKFVASFDHSVHGAALQAGKAEAAGCVDCHGAHAMNKAAVAGSRINRLHITATCAKCHQDQAKAYGTSVHALALQKGNLDSAGCTSCHGEHDITRHTDPASPVNKANLAQQVCAECHASVRLTRRYGLASDTFRTFSDSYHGLAVRGGAVVVVNCASCHGDHAIKSQDDPTSTINKANLASTCGQCHPGANTRFTVGSVHASEAQRETSPWLYWIANFYVALIIAVVGGMLVHNLLDFLRKTRHKLAVQKGEATELHVAHRLYLRMTVNERVQHAVLVVSFTALVITGFMLRYPEAWWVVGIRHFSSRAFEWRGLVHRIASIVMLASGVWHVLYLAFTPDGRQLFLDVLPRWRDLTDPLKVLKYNLGLAPDKPAFGRFSYIEKAEYWAMAWGTGLMTLTGAILWFDNTSMGYITKLGFDIARLVHFYEAVLATLAIIVWHFYFVIFNPDIYPMNLAWLTGRMSEGEMMEEHPLQLEAMKAAERAKAEGEGADGPPADS